MKKILFTLTYLLSISYLWGQSPSLFATLPTTLNENSGILISNPNKIWLHNDGGDSAKLYAIDTLGNILKTILIQNATNQDWEDITQDDSGHVYIGDFGNNNNNRQNLRIYKIEHPDSITGSSTTAQSISFYYPEQTAFPAPNNDKNYDVEAMLYYNDSLYLFTKNRTTPYSGYTRMYQIPADTGHHVAILIDSFATGQSNFYYSITGASLSADHSSMALINSNTIWVFTNFTGNRFFDGTVQTYPLGFVDQKEALDFKSNTELYFSSERSPLGAAKLYYFDFSPILNTPKLLRFDDIRVFPNPTEKYININFSLSETQKIKIQLLDNTGKLVELFQNKKMTAGEHQLKFELLDKNNGVYYLNIKAGKQKITKRIVLATK